MRRFTNSEGLSGNGLIGGTLAVRGLILVMCLIHLVQEMFPSLHIQQFASISATNVVLHLEMWRITLASFVHGGIFHILFNSISFHSVGSSVERHLGTVRFFIMVLVIDILTGIFYVIINSLLCLIYRDISYMDESAVGFSGVIFALMVISECCFTNNRQCRSLFGLVEVPAAAYPVAMLFLLQILVPHVSFVGHLSGILVGGLFAFTNIFHYLVPSAEFVRNNLDGENAFPRIYRLAQITETIANFRARFITRYYVLSPTPEQFITLDVKTVFRSIQQSLTSLLGSLQTRLLPQQSHTLPMYGNV